MNLQRCSGVLLHPSSLPGDCGIGTLGKEAYRFVDFLDKTQQSIWQLLPLGPTSYGDSPYQSFSTHAGNPYLIDLEQMADDHLLSLQGLSEARCQPTNAEPTVNYGALYNWKMPLLRQAAAEFFACSSSKLADFKVFCSQQASWLDDYALFMAIKDSRNSESWTNWPNELRLRKATALNQAKQQLQQETDTYRFIQWVFFGQWKRLKEYANQKGIQILGDLPIFVAMDSADAWTNTKLFAFDNQGHPTGLAGVPPDYFAKDGQLWGNPLYNWRKMQTDGYAWWLARIQSALAMYDIVRIDHFRGFAAYWEVAADAETAREGRWVKGPGADFFTAIQTSMGQELPFIAEDLGEITPDVIELRLQFGFPGMKILQFAFDGRSANPFLPYNYEENCLVYTGTHDNDTTRGWYEQSSKPAERDRFRRYFSTDGWDATWTLMRGAFASVAKVSIVPMQDILDLDGQARMNFPGHSEGNWQWRYKAEQLTDFTAQRLLELTETYGRRREALPDPESASKEQTGKTSAAQLAD